MKTSKQALRFGAVGVLNTIIDYVVLNSLVFLGFSLSFVIFGRKFLVANIISVAVAMVNSFILNKNWTFRFRGGNIYLQIFKFFIITAIGMFIIHQIVFNQFYYYFQPVSEFIVNIVHYLGLDKVFSDEFIVLNFSKSIAIAVSLIWNFLGYKFIVFKPRS